MAVAARADAAAIAKESFMLFDKKRKKICMTCLFVSCVMLLVRRCWFVVGSKEVSYYSLCKAKRF